MIELNINKDEFLRAKNYIFTIANITKNGITGLNFYLLDENGAIKKLIGGTTWNEKRGYYHEAGFGLDRVLSVLFSVAYDLGLKDSEVKQEKILKLY
jgi:hypothetical protein